MECILINPLAIIGKGHAHFIRDCYGGENVVSMIFPPLELAQTASFLRKHNISVGIIDANALHLSHRKVLAQIKKHNPSYVGFPSTYGTALSDISLAALIKKSFPEVKIIIYGINVTAEPDKVLELGVVDYVILGEPEAGFLNIISGNLDSNVAYNDSNGDSVITEIALVENLEVFPFPARDLLPNASYRSSFTRTNPFTTMYTSRGCSYRCIFCPVCIWNKRKVRYRSTENVMFEIEEVVGRYNIRDIVFRDPVFTANPEHVFVFCEQILKAGYKINWRCFSHAADADEKLLRLMRQAGCYQVSYGFETGSSEILRLTSKSLTVEQSLKAAELTRKAGIEISGSFMFGLPGETEKTIEDTIRFAKKLKLDYAQFQLAFSIPGTELNSLPRDGNNYSIAINKKEWSWNNWDDALDQASGFSGQLRSAIKNAYRSFYFRVDYIIMQLYKTRSLTQLLCKIKILRMFFLRRLV